MAWAGQSPRGYTVATRSAETPRSASARATETASPIPASSVHPRTVGRPSLQSSATTMRDDKDEEEKLEEEEDFLRRWVNAERSRNGKLPTTARAVLTPSKKSSTAAAVRSPPPRSEERR